MNFNEDVLFFFQCFIYVLTHVNDLKSRKSITTDASPPQKTLLLKGLISSPACPR